MIQAPVLVLNQNYQPLNICNVRRAMVLVGLGKAELMANGRGDIRTVSASFAVPSVIRLVYMVKQPIIRRRLSRRAIFYRDNFVCQYCGAKGKTLTLDHIVPRSRGGTHEWDNVVSACVQCNHRKAGLDAVGGAHASAQEAFSAEAGALRAVPPPPHTGRVARVHPLG